MTTIKAFITRHALLTYHDGGAPVEHDATRFPVRFAVLVTLAFAAIDGGAALALPRLAGDDRIVSVIQDAGQYVLAIGLLASLAWWRRAGFPTLPSARALLLLLPLLIFPARVSSRRRSRPASPRKPSSGG